jgi:hypothetical protein
MAAGRSRWRLLALPVAAVALFLLLQGAVMAKLVLFSAVEGTITRNGTPVAGAKVTREFLWSMKRENGSDTTVTDAAGRFSLPEITRRSLMAMFPHEPVVRQTITIAADGTSYKAWVYFKRNYDDNGELRRPIRLKCRLETEPASRPASYDEVFGVCDLG